jgi:hypothetical protein
MGMRVRMTWCFSVAVPSSVAVSACTLRVLTEGQRLCLNRIIAHMSAAVAQREDRDIAVSVLPVSVTVYAVQTVHTCVCVCVCVCVSVCVRLCARLVSHI